MILKNKYPICEFDTSKNPIIQPGDFLAKSLPEKCVITFFRKELDRFARENNLPVIGYLNQLLYAGDDVSGEVWDSRNWNTQKNIRDNLISYAVEIVKKM